MKTEHTPGPWRMVEISTASTIIKSEDNRHNQETLATVHRFLGSPVLMDKDGQGDANARLIAAAPSLLNMLQRMVDETNESSTPCLSTLEHARAAIRKATQ